MVVLEGIVSYIVGLHKYYEPEVLPAETDESSNTFQINMFELLSGFTPTMLSPLWIYFCEHLEQWNLAGTSLKACAWYS